MWSINMYVIMINSNDGGVPLLRKKSSFKRKSVAVVVLDTVRVLRYMYMYTEPKL